MTTRRSVVMGGALVAVALLGGAVIAWWSLWRPNLPPDASAPAAVAPTDPAARPDPWRVDINGAATAILPRTVAMDLAPVTGRSRRVEVRYDLDAVLRPTTIDGIRGGPDWVAGVRLLLGEVGAGRLRVNRWSLLEAVGILETVHNRVEPRLANPLGMPGVPRWPGCGEGAVFASCIDPQQYRGLGTTRALRPREAVHDEAELLAGVDRAVLAWFVFKEALLGEVTAGATSFNHMCGGSAWGRPPETCIGLGPDAHRGPTVFTGPGAWLEEEGRYAMETLVVVDYAEGPPPDDEGAYARYLRVGDGGPR